MLGGDGPAALAEAGSPGAFAAKACDHAFKDLEVGSKFALLLDERLKSEWFGEVEHGVGVSVGAGEG
jgi:hypothetical protein